MDDTDPLVTVMKVEKAPQETYADIGGLDNQIQEIKVRLGTSAGCLDCGFLTMSTVRVRGLVLHVLGVFFFSLLIRPVTDSELASCILYVLIRRG